MSIIGDKLVDAEDFRRLLRTATKAGYSLRTLRSGYLITTTSGTIHLTDLESVADTLGRLKRAEAKATIKREAHPALSTWLTATIPPSLTGMVLENTFSTRSNRPVRAVLSCPNSVMFFGADWAIREDVRQAVVLVFNICPPRA